MSPACRTNLLSDSPADKDAFGPHKQLADVIADLVTSSEGSRVIGLAGKWGAGKSTVIGLLRELLSQRSNARLFVFDAWAHEGDPLRRNFLERLVDFLVESQWLQRKRWQLLRDELAGRRKVTEEKQIPRPTAFGVVISASLLFVPVGAALFSDLLDNWSQASQRRIVATWLAMMAPIVATLACSLLALVRGRNVREALAVFVSPSIQSITTERSEDPEATSVEFEQFFSRVLMEALADNSRRLVVVLDNLDRVSSETAQKVWTALQTFVGATGPSIPHGEQVWFLVPYAKEHIADPLQLSANSREAAEGFVAKRISVEFHVPEPVLTNWRKYLVDSLAVALPDHSPPEFESVYHVYSAFRADTSGAPTPRDLKQFINQIGSLHQLRGDDFPLNDIGYYVALQLASKDVVSHLLKDDVPGPRFQGLVSDTVTDSLAALHFGVPVDQARQLLLRGPIESALKSGDGKKLATLKNVVGFQSVLQQINPLEYESSQAGSIPLICFALDSAGLLDVEQFGASTFGGRLRQALLRPNAWNAANESLAQGLASAISAYGENFAAEILKRISATASTEKKLQEQDIELWARGVRNILSRMRSSGMKLPPDGSIRISIEPKHWFVVAHTLAGDSSDWEFVRAVAPTDGLDAVVGSVPSELAGRTLEDVGLTAESAQALAELAPNAPWPAFWDQVRTKVQAAESNEASAAMKLILTGVTAGQPSAEAVLRTCAESGYVHHQLDFYLRKKPDAAGILIAALLRAGLLLSTPPAVEKSAAGHTRLLEFLRQPESRPDLVTFISALDVRAFQLREFVETAKTNSDAAPLASALIKQFAESHRLNDLLTVEEIVSSWSSWRSLLLKGESGELVLAELATSGLVRAIVSGEFRAESSDLYILIGKILGWSADGFGQWCVSSLAKLSSPDWENALTTGSDVANVALEVGRVQAGVDLGGAYADAIVRISRVIAVSGDAPALFKSQLPEVRGLCGASESYAREGIVGTFVDAGGAVSDVFFEVFTEELQHVDTLKQERRLVEKLLNPILSNHRVAGVRWAAKLFQNQPELLAQLQHADEFRDLLKTELERTDLEPSVKDGFERLAVAIRLTPSDAA